MSKALTVLHNPDQQLRAVSAPVAPDQVMSEAIQTLIEDLKITMRVENGIGIAAPQVGVLERVIIVDMNHLPTAFINPEIIESSFKLINSDEGCLSVPGTWGIVKRHRSVTVTALDSRGQTITLKASDLLATVFQHEIDHLNGILFIDRASSLSDSGTALI